MRVSIVLTGSHGGELDRVLIEVRADQDQEAVIKNAVLSSVEDWTLSLGDVITILETK